MSKIDTTNVVAWQSVHYGIPIDETHDPAEAQKWLDSGVTVRSLYTSPQPAQEPVAGVVIREGLPTLLQDRHIKPTDHRLYTSPPASKPKNVMRVKRISDQSVELVFTSCAAASEFIVAHGLKGEQK